MVTDLGGALVPATRPLGTWHGALAFGLIIDAIRILWQHPRAHRYDQIYQDTLAWVRDGDVGAVTWQACCAVLWPHVDDAALGAAILARIPIAAPQAAVSHPFLPGPLPAWWEGVQ